MNKDEELSTKKTEEKKEKISKTGVQGRGR